MNEFQAISILIAVAELAQKAGALTLEDANAAFAAKQLLTKKLDDAQKAAQEQAAQEQAVQPTVNSDVKKRPIDK